VVSVVTRDSSRGTAPGTSAGYRCLGRGMNPGLRPRPRRSRRCTTIMGLRTWRSSAQPAAVETTHTRRDAHDTQLKSFAASDSPLMSQCGRPHLVRCNNRSFVGTCQRHNSIRIRRLDSTCFCGCLSWRGHSPRSGVVTSPATPHADEVNLGLLRAR
jgi:hypothetical protein